MDFSRDLKNRDIWHLTLSDLIIDISKNRGLTEDLQSRWVNAIGKAARRIEIDGFAITWEPEKDYLLIWSQSSNNIYEIKKGFGCTCRAAEFANPCWHLAAKKILRRYSQNLEAMEDFVEDFMGDLEKDKNKILESDLLGAERCESCQKPKVKEKGEICETCQQSASPLLKPDNRKPSEKIGNIKI